MRGKLADAKLFRIAMQYFTKPATTEKYQLLLKNHWLCLRLFEWKNANAWLVVREQNISMDLALTFFLCFFC